MIDHLIHTQYIPAPCATVAHATTLVLYAATVIGGSVTAFAVRRVQDQIVRRYVGTLLLLVMCASAVFLVAQIIWFEAIPAGDIGSGSNTVWLVFDWINGVTLLATVGALRIFCLWRYPRCADAPDNCPRRVRVHPPTHQP